MSSKVNINKIFDEILPKIRDFLIKNGLEPINLPNYTENIVRSYAKKFKKLKDYRDKERNKKRSKQRNKKIYSLFV